MDHYNSSLILDPFLSLVFGAPVFPSLSFPYSPSLLLPSSLLAVHISVCSQELAGLCQTEIR